MSRNAGRRGRSTAATGYLGPDGQLWQVPTYPRPTVILDTQSVSVDGRTYPARRGQEPRDAANAALIDLVLRLRGEAGAIHADVRMAGDEHTWPVVVTGTGDVFDATPTGTGGSSRRNGRLLLAGGGVLVAVLGLATAVAVVLSQSSPPPPVVASVGPAPTGTPTPYPNLPPAGFSGTAAWSAHISSEADPLITTTGQVVTVSPAGSSDRTLDVRDPATGITAWSAVLPRAAGSGAQGLRLSTVDGQESVVATTTDSLVWWPLQGTDHTPRTVTLPAMATVSYAGSTPLVTWPAQHAGIVTAGALTDVAVPAGAVAVGANADTIVAANSVGQLWRLTATTAAFPPAPIATAAAVPGATALESVAGYAAPQTAAPEPAGAAAELLILTWYTPDTATRVVSLLDATTGTAVGAPVTSTRAELSGGWQPSEHNTLGTLGGLLLDTAGPVLRALPTGWRTTAVNDTQVHGSTGTTLMVATADGATTPTGSGVIPIGVVPAVTIAGGPATDLAVVTASTGNATTLYGLPVATAAAGPTPSTAVPAPPALRPTNAVPGPAPAPTTATTPSAPPA